MKIHVMQIIHTLDFGGAERLAATISASLPREQFRVSVCGISGAAGPLTNDLRRRKIPYFFLEAEKKSRARLLFDLYRLLKREQIDLVQVHGAYPLLRCFIPAKLAGARIVYTEHAKQSILQFRAIRLAARYLPRFIDKTVCVSDNLRSFFREHLALPDRRLALIYNGIDASRFDVQRRPFAEAGGARTIGCIARLTEAKDHRNLLTAFHRVVQRRGGVRLMLVGEGEERGCIEEMITDLGLAPHVQMMGSRDDIPELLAGMDIFVLSSKREGFPVAILEAMAAGRPVIATAVGGVPEVIASGYNGVIVPVQDAEALARAIVQLLDEPDLTVEMARKGRTLVRSAFDDSVMSQQYASLFHHLMGAT